MGPVARIASGRTFGEKCIVGSAPLPRKSFGGRNVKSEEELKKVEGSISKSNAPSKTKPVTAPLFRNTGAKAFVDREPLPQRKLKEVCD